MSFTKLSHDKQAYKTTINQSVKNASYQLNKPRVSCKQCYPYPVSVIPQQQGVSVFKNKHLVDVGSELRGITRKASAVPSEKYVPNCVIGKCGSGYPCGQGVIDNCGSQKPGQRAGDEGLVHWKDCFIPSEDTRTSNPACNLRGTGWNRWEWLSRDPQEHLEKNFKNQVSTRIMVKDNHRPTLPNPIDNTSSLPNAGEAPYNDLNGDYASYN